MNTWSFELEETNAQTGEIENKSYSLATVPTWNEKSILARAERLSAEAAKVWIAPQLKPDVLDAYRSNTTQAGQKYAITDHPYLASGPIHELFEAFRQAVLTLDPYN